jgi:hypothetical protein
LNTTGDLRVDGSSVGELSSSVASRVGSGDGHVALLVSVTKDAVSQMAVTTDAEWDTGSADRRASFHHDVLITDTLNLTSRVSVDMGGENATVMHAISVTTGSDESEQFRSSGIQAWYGGSSGSAMITHDLLYPHSIPVLGVSELQWSVQGDMSYTSDGVDVEMSNSREDKSEMASMRMSSRYGGRLGDG